MSSIPVVTGGQQRSDVMWPFGCVCVCVTSIYTLTFNNCVSLISPVLDQCVKVIQNVVLNRTGLHVKLTSDLWQRWRCTTLRTHTGSRASAQINICILGGVSLCQKMDSLKTIYWRELFHRPRIKWLSPENCHSWFHIELELIYYKDTVSYHRTPELISYQMVKEHFWRLNMAGM